MLILQQPIMRSLLLIVAISLSSALGAPLDAVPDLSLDLLPPQQSSQHYWGTPGTADNPETPTPDEARSADGLNLYRLPRSHNSREEPLMSDTSTNLLVQPLELNAERRVLMIYTIQGPEILVENFHAERDEIEQVEGSESLEESDWKDAESETEKPSEATSTLAREKRNKRPIRYRIKSKNRGRPTL